MKLRSLPTQKPVSILQSSPRVNPKSAESRMSKSIALMNKFRRRTSSFFRSLVKKEEKKSEASLFVDMILPMVERLSEEKRVKVQMDIQKLIIENLYEQ